MVRTMNAFEILLVLQLGVSKRRIDSTGEVTEELFELNERRSEREMKGNGREELLDL